MQRAIATIDRTINNYVPTRASEPPPPNLSPRVDARLCMQPVTGGSGVAAGVHDGHSMTHD